MNVVLLTGSGSEHQYVSSVFAQEFGTDLSAVIVSNAPRESWAQQITRYRRRYSSAQIASRVAARLYRAAHRLDQRRSATFRAHLDTQHLPTVHPIGVAGHNSDECLAILDEIMPNVIGVYGTGIIRSSVCDRARAGVLNLHTGLSPKYRGADTVFWPLFNEEPEWIGVTVHGLTEEIDGGPIFATARPSIEAEDSEDSLFAKSVTLGAEVLIEQIREVAAGRASPKPQDLDVGRQYRFVDRTVAAERRVLRLLRGGMLERHLAR